MKTTFKNVVAVCFVCLASLSAKAGEININGLTVVQSQSAIQTEIDAVGSGGSVTVVNRSGSNNVAYTGANATLTLNIPTNVTVVWDLEYSGASAFTGSLITLSGPGIFEVASAGSVVHNGSGEALHVTGANASVIVYGTVFAKGGNAVHATSTSTGFTIVVAGNGTVSNEGVLAPQAAIRVDDTASPGLNVTVKNNGKVMALENTGYAIVTYGNVQIDDFAEVKSQGGGVAIDALGASSTVTVNGGTVSTTGGLNTDVIGGSAISCHYRIVVNGGTVSATTGKAVHTTNAGGIVEINGGTVMATEGYAIRADNTSYTITVNGGFVFAYGTVLTVLNGTNGVTNRTPTVTGGVVVAWDNLIADPYMAFSNTALTMNPVGSAMWYDYGSGGGIAYANGTNTGFFPLNVTVTALHPDANGVLYVNFTRSGDGSSWANAYPNLAVPLLYAARQRALLGSPDNLIQQIWVAGGTYEPFYTADGYNYTAKTFPDTPSGSDNAFVLVPDVKIYGGFAGWESSPVSRSGWATVLSGNTSSAHHVMLSVDHVGSALLDGFTITEGNANGSGTITVNSQPINRSSGGGMYLDNSSPLLANIIFSGNSAVDGGGMYLDNSSSVLANVIFSGNSANDGGGMYNNSSSPLLANVTLSGNSAANSGGGIYNSFSSPAISNSIIWGNIASADHNVLDASSNPVYAHSLVEDITASGIISNDDPQFVDWIDPSSAPMPNNTGNYRLQVNSVAINAGDNALYLTARGITHFTGETDLAGNQRLVGAGIDLGAYEYPVALYPVTVSSVSPDATGGGNYPAGVTVSIYAGTPPAGMRLVEWTASPSVNFDDAGQPTTTFPMPASAVTVTATFGLTEDVDVIESALKVIMEAIMDTAWIVSQPQAPNIEALIKWLVPQINSLIDTTGITVTASDITIIEFIPSVSRADGSFRFTVQLTQGASSRTTPIMPGIIIAAPYTIWVHIITLTPAPNGMLKSDHEFALLDELIKVNILPDPGYVLDSITVHRTGREEWFFPHTVENNVCTFQMPLAHVTITATFRSDITGIEAVSQANALKAFAQNGTLHVSGLTPGQVWHVYSLTGTLIYQGTANSDKAEITLPGQGVYIVTDGKSVLKIRFD